MPVNSIDQIRLCDEWIRPVADRLAKAYNYGVTVDDQWIAIGGGQAATDVLRDAIMRWIDMAGEGRTFARNLVDEWDAEGGNAFIPNTSDQVHDSSDRTAQDVLRPPMTGIIVNSLVNRAIEQATLWAVNDWRLLLRLRRRGAADLSAADAGSVITHFRTLRTDYEATSGAKLNTVLAVAVNPNP